MIALWWLAGWLLLIAAALVIGCRVRSYRDAQDREVADRFGLEPADMWWAGS